MTFGISVSVPLPFDEALARVTAELQREGFGIITTIDAREVFRAKLGAEFKRYTILGACNPSFAMKGLQEDEAVGLLLPCNVVVSEDGPSTNVTMFDPMLMATMVQRPSILALASEIRARLERSILALPHDGPAVAVPV